MLIPIVVLVMLSLWLLWAFHPVFSPHVLPFINEKLGTDWAWALEHSGPWGDTFGALNTLFASLGFIAVLVTLQQQQRQIKAAQDDQHRQRFESSYFELLKLFREARTDLKFAHTDEYNLKHTSKSDDRATGTDAMRAAWDEVLFHAKQIRPMADRKKVAEIYEKHVHMRYESRLGAYFRILYTILHRIKTDKVLTEEERHKYANLVRSQLTTYELLVIALNGLCDFSKDFGDLIVEFRLLKYVPKGKRRATLARYYPEKAFAPRD